MGEWPDEVEIPAQVFVHAALHDAEERLVPPRLRPPAAFRPAVGALHRVARRFAGRGMADALVEAHDYVGAELLFRLDHALRRQALLAAVDV